MLEIYLKDGNLIRFKPEEYTDYEYRTAVFVVIKGNQWVGIFSMDCVKWIMYKELDNK